jgi:cell division septation protein DedD
MTEPATPVDRSQRLRQRFVGTAITRSNIPERPPGFRVEEIALAPEIAAAPESPSETRQEAPAAPVGPAPTGAPQAETAASEGVQLHGFAVQIGSFSSEENATSLRDRLRGKGYSAFVDPATVDGRTVFRVLVGPDARREHSERLRDRLAGEMDLRGVVIAFE